MRRGAMGDPEPRTAIRIFKQRDEDVLFCCFPTPLRAVYVF